MDDYQRLLNPNNNRRIDIVGFTEHWTEARFGDPTVTIWGMNDFWRVGTPEHLGRIDAWFDMHQAETRHLKPGAREWLAQWTKPYVTPDGDTTAPNSVIYPIGEITRTFGTEYFTNTVAFQIALAALILRPQLETYKHAMNQAAADGATEDDLARLQTELQPEIGVFGVDMAADSEYGFQRPSCEYLIGWVQGLDFRVTLPTGSDLLKVSEMYGYGNGALIGKMEHRRMWLSGKSQELTGRRNQLVAELGQVDNAIAEIRGALAEYGYLMSRFTVPSVESTRSDV